MNTLYGFHGVEHPIYRANPGIGCSTGCRATTATVQRESAAFLTVALRRAVHFSPFQGLRSSRLLKRDGIGRPRYPPAVSRKTLTKFFQKIPIAELQPEVILEGVLRRRAHLYREMQQGLQSRYRNLSTGPEHCSARAVKGKASVIRENQKGSS